MGTTICHTISKPTATTSRTSRVNYELSKKEDIKRITDFFNNVIARAGVHGVTALQLKTFGVKMYEEISCSNVSASQFMNTCSSGRPKEFSEYEWYRFASSTVLECFQKNALCELHHNTMMKIATFFARSLPRRPIMEDASSRSSIILKEACRQPFTDNGSDNLSIDKSFICTGAEFFECDLERSISECAPVNSECSYQMSSSIKQPSVLCDGDMSENAEESAVLKHTMVCLGDF